MPPDTGLGVCAECGRPAKIECADCSEGVDINGALSPVEYCSIDCQEEHNFEHLYICKEKNDRKALYRGVGLLHSVFLTTVNLTRGRPFDRVDQRGGKIHIYRDVAVEPDDPKVYPNAYDWIKDDTVRKTVAAFQASAFTRIQLLDVISKVLQGVTKSLEEMAIELPATQAPVVLHELPNSAKNPRLNDHLVLVAKGTDDVEYIIDLGGAQFGQFEPIMPMAEYKKYIHKVLLRHKHGFAREVHRDLLEGKGPYDVPFDSPHQLVFIKQFNVMAHLNSAVAEWESSSKISVGGILHQPSKQFEAQEASLLARISNDFALFVPSLKYKSSAPDIAREEEACASCGQDCATPLLIWTDCADGVNENGVPTYTVYCDTVCRKADSRDHIKLCSAKNDRKELYRAGEILQAAFYIWRETAFDVKAARISKATRKPRKDYLVLQEGDYDVKPHGPLYALPKIEHLNNNEKNAVLTCSACTDAMIYLHSLSKKLLAGIAEEVWETDARVTDSDYSILRVTSTFATIGYSAKHQFLTVEAAADGERYVLDPAGAQLGQYHAVLSPAQQVHWMTRDIKLLDHGSAAAQAVKLRSGERYVPPEADVSVHHVHAAREKVLEQTIEEWEQKHEQSGSEMLRGDQKTYDADKASFLDTIRAALKQWSADYESGVIKVEIPKHHRRAIHQAPASDGVDQADVVGTPEFFAKLKALNMNVHYC